MVGFWLIYQIKKTKKIDKEIHLFLTTLRKTNEKYKERNKEQNSSSQNCSEVF